MPTSCHFFSAAAVVGCCLAVAGVATWCVQMLLRDAELAAAFTRMPILMIGG